MTAFPPLFPGGNRIGAEEEEAVIRTLRSRRLFRYYGVSEGPSAVEAFETAFAERMGTGTPSRWHGRAVHLDVSPDLSEAHADAIGRSLGEAIAHG